MRRHEETGEAPESWSPENAYGSAIHLCLAMLDDGATPDEAAQAAFAQFKAWLEPSDLSRLHEDMEKYLAREILGVKTLLNEGEISVPLFEHPTAGQVWFRARIDRLYQSLEDPSHLIHIDYKSGKWAKSHEEVSADIQLWSYNWGIWEWFADLYPEVEGVHLDQVYDQLRHGQIPPSPKSAAQRAEIKRWLTAAVTAMIDEAEPVASFNTWCPWCPLKMDCPVVQFQLTDWATTTIAALMPRAEKLNKDGSVSKRPAVHLDESRLAEYVELLPDVKRAAQVLSAFDDNVKGVLKRLSDDALNGLGKRKIERSSRVFTTAAKREIVELIGLPRALMLFDVSLAAVERFFADDDDTGTVIAALAEKQPGYTLVVDA